ncbi:MAG: branched-chain amino acid ABC transporter permease [Polaromonas sp.]|nr:branched-chain amino acid ABC transporter permease [Polaromonas sp.]
MGLLQLLNGLSLAALLFVVASGFTLIFGLLRIVNLAHGSIYLFGGYVGYAVGAWYGSFALACVAGFFSVVILGLLLDQCLLRFVRGSDLRQVLLTLGVTFVLNDLMLVIWGGDTFNVKVPALLQGATTFGSITFPKFRYFVIGLGVVVFIALWLMLNKTKLGCLIRAGVDDVEMVEAVGIPIRKIFLFTFLLGCGLAGLGGVVGGAFLTLYPSADSEILVFSLAIVIIGGRGSLLGAAVGSILVGLLSTTGMVMFPELAYFVLFAPMALILAFRPQGILGKSV